MTIWRGRGEEREREREGRGGREGKRWRTDNVMYILLHSEMATNKELLLAILWVVKK